MAEREGFEPPGPEGPAVFKTAVINQTLPPLRGLIHYFKEQKKTETFKGPGFI